MKRMRPCFPYTNQYVLQKIDPEIFMGEVHHWLWHIWQVKKQILKVKNEEGLWLGNNAKMGALIPHEQKVTWAVEYMSLSRAAEQLNMICRRNFRDTILRNP